MQHDISKLCYDILQGIEDIRNFTAGLDFDNYQQSRIVKLAVEPNYEIIGEALRRMQARFEAESTRVTDGRKIIDFRNLLAHAYDGIADEIVWPITTSDLNILESDIQRILKENE